MFPHQYHYGCSAKCTECGSFIWPLIKDSFFYNFNVLVSFRTVTNRVGLKRTLPCASVCTTPMNSCYSMESFPSSTSSRASWTARRVCPGPKQKSPRTTNFRSSWMNYEKKLSHRWRATPMKVFCFRSFLPGDARSWTCPSQAQRLRVILSWWN